jgi:hypothetical protein
MGRQMEQALALDESAIMMARIAMYFFIFVGF